MSVVAVFVSDRGDRYLPDCLASFAKHADHAHIDATHVVDDREHRLGMAGAVQAGWAWAYDTGADYLLHVEEDFRFVELPLAAMAKVLHDNPHLAQVVLKRQPWSAEEKAAGGQIEVDPDAYTDCATHVEHELLFSLNPSLIRREVLALGGGLEVDVTQRCLAAGYRFAYYGGRDDPPRCIHVGDERGEGWRL